MPDTGFPENTSPTRPALRGPIAWMAGHSVTANLIMLVLLVGGLLWSMHIKQEVFPDFELDFVNITVAYPGASPSEVERGIIWAIEEAVQGLEGIEEVTAKANEGVGTVTVEVLEGTDPGRMAQKIQNEVDQITSFPDEAEQPKVAIADRKRSVVSVILHGDQSEWVLRQWAEDLRMRMLQDPDITQVDLEGIRDFEISIEIPQDTLRAYGLTLDEVAQKIGAAAVELPGGSIKTEAGDVLVRMKERRNFGREFGSLPVVTSNDGTEVRLADIARIEDGFEESDRFATYNGHRAIRLEVSRVGDQTPITVSDAVKRQVLNLEASLPPGLHLSLLNDRSDIYRQRLNLMLRNGFLGLGLVFIVLAVFLEARLAFWVSLGIPISFLGSLLFLPAAGVSINMVSLFAFIVTLGIVVDDAIVVGENVYYHRQQGLPWLQAAVHGARDIAMPVTFSVLTNMVAFLPLMFIPGIMGKVFSQIPVVVLSVFAISLVESLFVLPAHLGHQAEDRSPGPLAFLHRAQQRFSLFFANMVQRHYGDLLEWLLRNRYVTLCIGLAILLLTYGYVQSGRMGRTLFPKIESDYARVTATLPYGTAVQKTTAVRDRLVAAVRAVTDENGGDSLLKGIYATVSDNQTTITAYLTDADVRPISTAEVTRRWRERAGHMVGIESILFESDAGGPGRGASISVEMRHENLAVLEAASAALAEALGYYPNVSDIDDGFSPGKQQIDFNIKPEGRSLGLTAREIARQVRHAYYGAEALRQQRGRNEVKVMVRLPLTERISEHNLEEMILRAPNGVEIPLREAVRLKRGRAYTSIDRRNGQRVVTATANVRPVSQSEQVLASLKTDVLPHLVSKYSGLSYSFEGRQADMRESMQSLTKGLLLALLVIFAMLAIPFNSYIQPIIVIACVPFGIVGAIIGHLIMGFSLSVMSMFGVVALSGVVINDSLVLIDYANRRRRRGDNAHDAVHASGIQRFRPILLTTLTTFGGLMPMIFETSRQARFLIPMAISLGFGIVFATLITLALVPSIYLIVDDLQGLIAIRGEAGPVAEEAGPQGINKKAVQVGGHNR
jgi:multidrug efflux pump subunit AcrB